MTVAYICQSKAFVVDSHLVRAHSFNLCYDGYLHLITWHPNQPGVKQSKWKRHICGSWSINFFSQLFSFSNIFDVLNPPCLLFYLKSMQVEKNCIKSHQTILQKACVMAGLPLATMQSPTNKAQVKATVLEAMMRFVPCPRHHWGKVFTAWVFIDHHKKGSHLMSTSWSCGSRAKAISVTLHGVVHASEPAISSRISGHLEHWTTTATFYLCVCILKETYSNWVQSVREEHSEIKL